MVENISKISIKGRMLFCLNCVENAFQRFRINNSESKFVLSIIEQFFIQDSLSDWEDMAEDILPSNLLDSTFDLKDFVYFDNDCILNIKNFYEHCSKDIVDIIDNTFSVGLNNLYGGTGLDNPLTLKPVLEVIELCVKNNIEVPDISDYLKHRYEVNGGFEGL